jgi:hypothetical protein
LYLCLSCCFGKIGSFTVELVRDVSEFSEIFCRRDAKLAGLSFHAAEEQGVRWGCLSYDMGRCAAM